MAELYGAKQVWWWAGRCKAGGGGQAGAKQVVVGRQLQSRWWWAGRCIAGGEAKEVVVGRQLQSRCHKTTLLCVLAACLHCNFPAALLCSQGLARQQLVWRLDGWAGNMSLRVRYLVGVDGRCLPDDKGDCHCQF